MAWSAVFFYMALIFWLSHQTRPLETPIEGPMLGFLVHAAEYALLSALVGWACLKSPSSWWQGHALHFAIMWAALYGLTDELHQAMIPGRACEFIDWVADVSGAIAVQLAWLSSDS